MAIMNRRRRFAAFGAAAGLALLAVGAGAPAPAATAPPHVNWTEFHKTTTLSSYSPSATAITTANAANLVQKLHLVMPPPTQTNQPGPTIYSSPAVWRGVAYFGDNTGDFMAWNLSNGTMLWKRNLGWQPKITCAGVGVVDSPAIAPSTGDPNKMVVYIGGGDGAEYELDLTTGNVIWQTQIVTPSTTTNDYLLWASPTVRNNDLYIATSSNCDNPLVPAEVLRLDRGTGSILSQFHTMPPGYSGGSVLASVAAPMDGTNSIYVATANPYLPQENVPGYEESIIKLDGASLAVQSFWQVPIDQRAKDTGFISSPTLFLANIAGKQHQMVGACDKNGYFYALDRKNLAAGPVWADHISPSNSNPDSCIGSASYDGTTLYIPGANTTINGQSCGGSVRAADPATGAFIWEKCMPNVVLSAPTIDGAGVLGVEEFSFTSSTAGFYLLDKTNGNTLFHTQHGNAFGGAVFADNMVLYPSVGSGVWVYTPPA
jgi:outer membrane protein assembly factor BamB